MVRQKNREKIFVRFLTFVALMLSISISVPVHAQVAGGTFTGTITDSSGAAVPNAQVIIKNTATGVTNTTVTNTAGAYTVPNLLPGTYDITASAPGFSTAVQSGVTLTVGATQVLNLPLTVGQVSQTVEVTAEAPTVELASSSISATVNSTEVRELPLNGRDWTQLATLQPGVTSLSALQPSIGFTNASARGNRGFGNQMTISGARPGQNNYRLDGVSINDYENGSPGGVLGGALGVDAIAEFSVVTSNYSAEYGRTSGGVINAITRSGTNGFHGDAYEFLRNSAMDARNFFDGPTIPAFKRNQFGASAGAPIRKDKTFAFFDYEGLRQSLGVTNPDIVPSLDARKGLLHNTDGTTTDLSADPNFLLVKPYLVLWPAPSPNVAPLGVGNTTPYSIAAQQVTTENFITARVDNKFSEKDSLFGSFQWDHAQGHLPDPLGNVVYGQNSARRFVAIEESHVFSAQLINTVRFGFNRSSAVGGFSLAALNPAAADPKLGIFPGLDTPSIGITGVTSMGGGLTFPPATFFNWNSFQAYDDASLTRGIHSLKFGVAIERMQQNVVQYNSVDGGYSFASIANFLTNQPLSLSSSSLTALPGGGYRQTLFGGYLQDDIRLRSNLTVNVGLRYEMSTVPTEVKNKLANLRNPTDKMPYLGSPLFYNPTLRNFEPRVGFAWDPFKHGRTSVRGGFGVYDVLPLIYEYMLTVVNGAPFAIQDRSPSPLPQGSFPQIAAASLGALGTPRESYIESNPHRNYVMQWNFNIQQQLPGDFTATVAYVGSRGVHMLFKAADMNMVIPTLTSAGYLWPSPRNSGTVLNPNFGRIEIDTWGANSFYDGLELQVQKRMSHGFQIQGSYTWAKSIDESSTAAVTDQYANSINSPFFFDRKTHRSVSDFNLGQNVVINFTWNLPAPNSLHGAAGWALGGWEVGGILGARTGLPFTALVGGDPLGSKASSPLDFPNRIKGPGCETGVNPGNPNNYINVKCFSFPSPSTLLGNAGRNSLVGPGAVTFDFSLFKNMTVTKISESFKAQFRFEAFNIFNHANFNAPITLNAINTLFDVNGNQVAGAGRLTGTATSARDIQFGLKLIW